MTMTSIKMAGALAPALMILGTLGCSSASPARIPPATPPPPPPPLSSPASVGKIIASEIVPRPGSTLLVRDCGNSQLCTDQLQTTFDVVVPSDVQDAWVIVSLKDGSRGCAAAYIRTTLTANTPASFRVSSISMEWDEARQLLCSLPVETNRLVFSVFRDGAPAKALLSEEMPYRLILRAGSADAR
jgi:hypothetical protein